MQDREAKEIMPTTTVTKTPIERRREYLIREVQAFINKTGGKHRNPPLIVEGVPKVSGRGGNRVEIRGRVKGELLDEDWFEEIRDIINRARSLLDNAMWSAASGAEPGKYNSREKNAIKFPFVQDQAEWDVFCKTKHAQALGTKKINALHALQPFVTGDATVSMFNKANNVDKHRDPLQLAVLPDSLFAMVLGPGIAGVPGEDGKGFTWEPLAPIKNGRRVVRYTHSRPLPALEVEQVPVALNVQVNGIWLDVQEFLKDIIVFTAKVSFILDGESTIWADMHEKKFAAEREQLTHFRKMLRDSDAVAEAMWIASSPGGLPSRL